ncbi:MAG TPA: transposase [Gammaproteobacteria bacterium]|nr:transposase [Gammaproteobacteria bacterium]
MPRSRKSQISLDDTPYYHCICRCVRRAFLWGVDQYSGKDYSHRKQWVVEKLAELSGIFAIDVCAYAVMSNHYHVVLYVDKEQALSWSDETVIEHWSRLFSLPVLVSRYQNGQCHSAAERDAVRQLVATWRQRLHDISWYMRCLNEPLARRANVEDHCSGRFWEGRFRSQALLDEAGLLTCMAYVDLNPIRAGINPTPESSDFTSIQARIQALQSETPQVDSLPLKAFHTPGSKDPADTLPYSFQDYLALIDWTGRAVREDKRGSISEGIPTILERINIDPDQWQQLMQPRGKLFSSAIGRIDTMRLYAQSIGQSWCQGMGASQALFPT